MKENQERQWVKISKSKGLSLFSISTIYKMHSHRKHMNLFSRVGGSVFVDVNGLNGLIDKNAGKQTA